MDPPSSGKFREVPGAPGQAERVLSGGFQKRKPRKAINHVYSMQIGENRASQEKVKTSQGSRENLASKMKFQGAILRGKHDMVRAATSRAWFAGSLARRNDFIQNIHEHRKNCLHVFNNY